MYQLRSRSSISHREQGLRDRLRQRMENLSVWRQRKWQNPLATVAGLLSVEDYIRSMLLHLPKMLRRP